MTFSLRSFYWIFFYNVYSMFDALMDCFKGLVHPKMKISPCFTLKASYVYDFFFQMNPIGVILKMILALPSFIMAVDGCVFVQQPKSSQIKCIHP